jgi:transcriptional regulator with XRE-family HTH domain
MISEIGEKVKKLRSDKQMTLKALSELTNLSIGYLSQLERGKTTVALDSLLKIAEVLEVDFTYFFDMSNTNNSELCKSFERNLLFMEKDNYIEYKLSNNLSNMKLFPRLVEVLPQKEIEPVEVYVHEGEEFIYILEGILTYHYNGKVFDLYPGDAFHIRSDVPHNLINTTNKIVRLIAVSIPNKFEVDAGSK